MAEQTEVAPHGSPNPWFSSSGDIAHPDAPLGGGGTGGFRQAGPLSDEEIPPWSPPHPHGPSVKQIVLSETDEQALRTEDEELKKYPPQKAPPSTKTLKKQVKKLDTGAADVDVELEVLADANNVTLDHNASAETVMDPQGINLNTPGFDPDATGQKIGKIKGRWSMKGKVIVQTSYGTDASPSDKSAYGRGTTEADKLAGDTSLGFHEFCHRQDALDWLANKPLPEFQGKVGMTIEAFEKAETAFFDAFDQYWKDGDAFSINQTDEVGYKRSQFFADNP